MQSRALLRGLVALLLASSWASACGSARLVSPPADGPAGEQAVMERVLAVLPEEHRDNVVYLDQHGNVHVNRPELKQQVQFARPLGGGRYAWPDGSEFSLPEGNFGPAAGPTAVPTPPSGWVPPPCNLETSGSFRRVLSWPGSGPWWGLYRYAAFSANVWLPDASLGQVRMASQDTGYIYTGG